MSNTNRQPREIDGEVAHPTANWPKGGATS
jgi:hypothetical protein